MGLVFYSGYGRVGIDKYDHIVNIYFLGHLSYSGNLLLLIVHLRLQFSIFNSILKTTR